MATRPIAEQIIDQILAEDPRTWDEYSKVLQTAGVQNLQEITGEAEANANDSVVVEFLARWSAVEAALEVLAEGLGDDLPRAPRRPVTSARVARQFLGDHVFPKFQYTRTLRNELVHSRKSPGRDELALGIDFLEDILNELSSKSPDVAEVIAVARNKFTEMGTRFASF